ncbi:MAG: PH domain-containing protein [Bacillota bacterium]|jgi:hypothetical protein|nr:PH domain-containing protein [Bacillota bacterium]HOO30736.1 PH domain-containing protein [Bacillota bacterium]HPQ03083.1 PH domain-containing protein [Bacillota bacterium]HPZ13944.1 PH domain-containing protein [Bacillota bacterium]HQD79653.1 PH domain-containing protein [Bacillota bacterium]
MEREVREIIEEQLFSSEVILWAGRPRRGLALRASDWFLIPFSLVWLCIATEITGNARKFGVPSVRYEFGLSGRRVFAQPLTVFEVVGWLFIAIGLYLLVGRFFVDARVRRNTYYGVTDRRILILTGFFGNRFVSIPLDRVGEMNAIRRADGSGTIQFGRPTYIPGWGDSTMNGHHYQNWRRVDPPSFEMIEDVLSVRNIIVSAQQGTYDGSGGAGG